MEKKRTINSHFIKDQIIFLHIPKTAGSTFHSILNSRYSTEETFNVFGSRYSEPEIKSFIEAPLEGKRNIRLLKGHMPFGLHNYLPKGFEYITVLRHPVERVISQYFYIKKNQHNPLHETVEKGGMSLSEFVTSGVAVGMNNGQCRFLNGDLDEYKFNECDDILLENVKSNIEKHFIWVGITDRFDESILLLSHLLGWKKKPHYLLMNVSKVRKNSNEISEADIAKIQEYNRFDIELYKHANSLLDQKLTEISDFSSDIQNFTDLNAKLQRRWSWLPDQLHRFIV